MIIARGSIRATHARADASARATRFARDAIVRVRLDRPRARVVALASSRSRRRA